MDLGECNYGGGSYATAIVKYKRWHIGEEKGHHNVGGVWVTYSIEVGWGSSHEARDKEAWYVVA